MRLPRVIWVTAGTAARQALAERGGLLVGAAFYLAASIVLGTLWRTAAGANGGAVVGYTGLALTWYIAATEAVTVSLRIRLIEEIGDDISSGKIAVELLRPASVLAVRVASELGRAVPRTGLFAAAGMAFCTILVGPPVSAAGLALAVPSMVLAIACNIVMQHAFAGAAFWVRDTRSTWFLYQKLVFVLGGMLLPIEVLPSSLESVARALPFMAMAYAPGRLASGHVEPMLLVVQVAWLVGLSMVAVAVFTAGERRLQVVGG